MLQIAKLEIAILLSRIDFIADDLYVGCLSHASHEEQAGTNQSNLNGYSQVEDDRQQESYPQHNDITLRILHDA